MSLEAALAKRFCLPQKRKSVEPAEPKHKKAKPLRPSSSSRPSGAAAAPADGLTSADTDVGAAAETDAEHRARHSGKDWKKCARCRLLGQCHPSMWGQIPLIAHFLAVFTIKCGIRVRVVFIAGSCTSRTSGSRLQV